MKNAHKRSDRLAALRIVAIYAVVAALWIYLSDTALGLFTSDPAVLFRIAVFKGLLFIVVTGSLLYFLISRYIRGARLVHEELLTSRNLLNALIEGTTDAVFVKDQQGRYLLFNPAAAKITGKRPEEVIGHDDTFLFSAEEAAAIMAGDRWVLDAGQVMNYEDYLTASDGTYRAFLATKGPIFDAKGEVSGLFGISHDITERHRTEKALFESEERYRSLFEYMRDGCAYCRMLYDDQGRPCDFIYLDVNDAFERLTGLHDVIGKRVTEVLPGIKDSAPELFDIYGRVASTGRPEKFDINFEPLNSWLSVSVYSPQNQHFVAVFDNITERKQAEETREATIELLRTCNMAADLKDLMHDLILYFQRFTGCESVGVRLREGDDFPYYETRGFPEEFVRVENNLCAYDQAGELVRDYTGHPGYDCMCGNIICGRFDPSKPFFTTHGSFWSNCTTELLASTTDEDRQARTRNRCNNEGYESVALIPLRVHGESFGLFQFNDRRKHRFTIEKIILLENLVDYVAIALAKMRVDDALMESSQFSQQVINSVDEGVVVLDRGLRYQVWNPYMEQLSGVQAAEVLGKHLLEAFPFFKDLGIVERAEATLAGRKLPSIDFPYPFHETGRSGWITEMNAPLRNTKDDIVGVIVTIRDITDHKHAQDELREATQRLRLAIDSGRLGIWDRDIRSDALVWDERMFEIYGEDRDSFTGDFDAWKKCILPDDLAGALEANQATVRGEREYDAEFRILRPDGTVRNIKANGIVIRDEDGEAIRMIGLNQDITEQKIMEAQLRQSQKMEAIGQLAGGVAHDFNNILTVIYGYCYMLQSGTENNPTLRSSVDQVLAAAERAANLTRSLLAFSRKQTMSLKSVNLNDLILNVGKFLTRIIGEDIQFKTIFQANPLMIYADSGQVEQVLMNLATNARDAMPKGGLLTIETGIDEIREDFIHAHGYGARGKYVVMSVSDTGEGMDAETCKKIFEPFFTTKEVGKGTGLGLSIVYGVIKQHNGFVNVYSESGKGTTFRIYLHLDTEEHADSEEKSDHDYPRMGNETVLVAEDDASIRQFVGSILRKFGYEVISANDGADAVEKFKANSEKIDIIVMDMIMPIKSGKEANEEIRKLRPDVKVLFMSGYSPDLLHSKGIQYNADEVLIKPLHPLGLVRKLRSMLDQNSR
jgi:PAS domain S-box-containing protein